MLPRLGDVALQELRATDLDALYAELLRSGGRGGGGLSMSSVHHVHAALNKLLNDAERTGLVTRNVARLASAPSLTDRPRPGTGDDGVDAGRAGPRSSTRSTATATRRCSASLALTGMRRGELVGLRWSDLDLDRAAR